MTQRIDSIKWFLDGIPATTQNVMEGVYRDDVSYLLEKLNELSEKVEALQGNIRLEWEDNEDGMYSISLVLVRGEQRDTVQFFREMLKNPCWQLATDSGNAHTRSRSHVEAMIRSWCASKYPNLVVPPIPFTRKPWWDSLPESILQVVVLTRSLGFKIQDAGDLHLTFQVTGDVEKAAHALRTCWWSSELYQEPLVEVVPSEETSGLVRVSWEDDAMYIYANRPSDD